MGSFEAAMMPLSEAQHDAAARSRSLCGDAPLLDMGREAVIQ